MYYLVCGYHLVLVHCNRCRRAYAPISNTASHGNHEKINSWVSFSFLHECGVPLGSPLGRQSFATTFYINSKNLSKYEEVAFTRLVHVHVQYVIHSHTDESERNIWGCWDEVLDKTLNSHSASLHPDDYIAVNGYR